MSATRLMPGADPAILILCDHASADVPDGVALGVSDTAMASHIASDLGAGPLAIAIGQRLGAAVLLARWSRLVADTNRPPDHPDMVPEVSDGIAIPGNRAHDPTARAARLAIHRQFHDAVTRQIEAARPRLLVSIHSFTPILASNPAPRPWPVALLWNRDDRAIGPAHRALERHPDLGGPIGLNQPYSGRNLNYTMDRHAEARGIPYLGFEVRQDLLATPDRIVRWAGLLAESIHAAARTLAVPA